VRSDKDNPIALSANTQMSAASVPAPIAVVDDAAFSAALATARATRTHRFALWHLAQSCDDNRDDAPWRWHRVGAAATREHHYRTLEKVERFGDRYAWLITEEHHDVTGGIYSTDGTPLDPNWQPTGAGSLRTAANSHTWIPVQRLIAWNFCAPVAISDAPAPDADDFVQARRAIYTPENDVFVHFTQAAGPYEGRNGGHAAADNKYLAPRHITERMSAFLGGRPTASASEITIAVIRYIQRKGLQSGWRQIITPDATLSSLLDGRTEAFRLTELGVLLRPHYGDLVREE
jgi:hypothetical protein